MATAYDWTEEEIKRMAIGTPLVWMSGGCDDLVIYNHRTDEVACVMGTNGLVTNVKWSKLRPWSAAWAPPLSEQERDLLDKRSAELVSANKRIMRISEERVDLAKALSHVVRDSLAMEERVVAAETREALTLVMCTEMVELATKRRHSVLRHFVERYPDLFEGIPAPASGEDVADADEAGDGFGDWAPEALDALKSEGGSL